MMIMVVAVVVNDDDDDNDDDGVEWKLTKLEGRISTVFLAPAGGLLQGWAPEGQSASQEMMFLHTIFFTNRGFDTEKPLHCVT